MKPLRKTMVKLVIVAVIITPVLFFMSFFNSKKLVQNVPFSEFVDMIRQKLQEYNDKLPEDRVYLHFDKPFYKPGETIWFNAYVRNGIDMKASKQSDIVNVELISPKGNIISTIKLIMKSGKAAGDFTLTNELSGGMYKIKAYTNWQKNDESPAFFEKDIQVQQFILPNLKMKLDFERKAFGAKDDVLAKLQLTSNENKILANYKFKFVANLDGQKYLQKESETDNDGIAYIRFKLPETLNSNDGLLNVMIEYNGKTESISRSIPIVLGNIDLTFFPEGGDIVDGLNSTVAFRALNEFGKPADIEGFILDSKGNQVSKFSSFHQGMGAFDFKPEAGEKYYAQIIKPMMNDKKYNLPESLKRGYTLSIKDSEKNNLNITINSTEKEDLTIIAQIRGKIYHAETIKAIAGINTFKINTSEFPMGVAQITLFDKKGIERCERLVFVNKPKQLKISISTDKEKYLPREKVEMTITAKDERDMPIPANLSVSVVNDQLLTFADDKSGNILSQMLLEQDLNCKVEEPKFYFDEKESKANQALDYLLMTAGWRRFEWHKIIDGKIPLVQFEAEKAIIKGIVYDGSNSKTLNNATVKVVGSNIKTQTNQNGEYVLSGLDLSIHNTLEISYSNYYSESIIINSYGTNYNSYLYEKTNDRYFFDGGVVMLGAKNIPPVHVQNAVIDDFEGFEIIKENNENVDNLKGEQINQIEQIEQEDKDIEEGDDEFVGEIILDKRDKRFDVNKIKPQENKQIYYRAKVFAAPDYAKSDPVDMRTDFRSTIYWNPNLELDKKGKATIQFYNSDDISSFRAIVEGVASDGLLGHAENTFFTQLPFSMNVVLPIEVATEDELSIPLTLKNNTNKILNGALSISVPEGLISLNTIDLNQSIASNEVKVIYLNYKVTNKIGTGKFKIAFRNAGLGDAFEQELKIVAKGFPTLISFSGQQMDDDFSFTASSVVDGSFNVEFAAYPSVVSDLMKGIDAILREPSGCFEQTSMSSYPNLMVMDYLQTTGNDDAKLLAKAENLLDKGYKRLTTFETPEKGYEWFGGAPGHEALTAYGLMQFNDMKGVYKGVDNQMIERTAEWLMKRKDGQGGFQRNSRALDNFGGASDEITNAYIIYALTEAGYTNLEKEISENFKKAMESDDPYLMALMANTMYNQKDKKKGAELMSKIYKTQDKDGSFTGKSHSITRSGGLSLSIETTSLVIMAMLKNNPDIDKLQKAVEYLVKNRSGYGAFGSTQGTVLALKALTEYAKFSKKTDESGTIQIYVDGKKVAEKKYEKGENQAITIADLNQYLNEGKHKIRIKFAETSKALPYSMAVSWNTILPNSSNKCVIGLETGLNSEKIKVGETVRLSVALTNKTNQGQPMTVAIIGLPAGTTAQPWQLKELQEKKLVDYYETTGNNVILYYRQMIPNEVRRINLDLKAEIPGEYDAPTSCAYLYYTNEYKIWTSIPRLTITK